MLRSFRGDRCGVGGDVLRGLDVYGFCGECRGDFCEECGCGFCEECGCDLSCLSPLGLRVLPPVVLLLALLLLVRGIAGGETRSQKGKVV